MDPNSPTPSVAVNLTPTLARSRAEQIGFLEGRGYTQARLARRFRVSRNMIYLWYCHRTDSARVARNVAKLIARLEAREPLPQEAPHV